MDLDNILKSKVVLYGAGYYGMITQRICEKVGIKVAYFCDSNPEKWGRYFEEIEIIPPEKLKEIDKKKRVTVIITTNQDCFNQIITFLGSLNLRTENLFTRIELKALSSFSSTLKTGTDCNRLNSYIRNLQAISYSAKLRKNRADAIAEYLQCFDCNILVYQSGKVGSSTVQASLIASGLKSIHVHKLTAYDIDDPEAIIINGSLDELCKVIKNRKTVKIITLVREPLSKEFSFIFQRIGDDNVLSLSYDDDDTFLDACIKNLKRSAFGKDYIYGAQFDWFDRELKTVFGIDIFVHLFDKEKGYSIIKQDNIEVLVIKLEKLNDLEQVIGEFVGAPHFKLLNENEGSKKPYKYLYNSVKKAIKIPREIFSFYYKNNPRMDHFYSEEEKAAFLRKWEKNMAD